jgi:glycosyltransferase involved in cell wall biosynthesis
MTLAQGFAAGALLLGLVYVLVASALSLRAAFTMPVLRDLRPREPARWPSLSVVTPACNEGATIEDALRSRLAQGYLELEVMVVEDRSTDATASIVDRIAAEDPRLRALHIKELPRGWLGKLHALHRGAEAARGEWLLFTDADIHFAPETLRRAVAYCEERGLDFLTAMPEFQPVSLLLDAAVSAFVRNVSMAAHTRAVEDPTSRLAVGAASSTWCAARPSRRRPGFRT